MRILGVVSKRGLLGLRCLLLFDVFPFIDSAGKNVIDNYGVTQVSGKAHFANTTNAEVNRLKAPLSDGYSMQSDFDVVMTVNVQTYAGKSDQVLLDCTNSGNNMQFFLNSNGNVRLNFNQSGSSVNLDSLASSGYLLPVATDVLLKIERRGTTVKVLADGVQIAIASGALSARFGIQRSLSVGALDVNSPNGYGLYGTIENFSWVNL